MVVRFFIEKTKTKEANKIADKSGQAIGYQKKPN